MILEDVARDATTVDIVIDGNIEEEMIAMIQG